MRQAVRIPESAAGEKLALGDHTCSNVLAGIRTAKKTSAWTPV